jgi:pyruvate dehydrogenase E2 component (dihydrolipoamide acetyltransferase)
LEEGALLCEMITDKVTFEYEIEMPGRLLRRYCPDKSVLPIGYAVASVGDEDERPPAGIDAKNARLIEQQASKSKLDLDLFGDDGSEAPRPQRQQLEKRVRATPAARRIARENDVTIEAVAAWAGHDGPVSQADVEAYLDSVDDGDE